MINTQNPQVHRFSQQVALTQSQSQRQVVRETEVEFPASRPADGYSQRANLSGADGFPVSGSSEPTRSEVPVTNNRVSADSPNTGNSFMGYTKSGNEIHSSPQGTLIVLNNDPEQHLYSGEPDIVRATIHTGIDLSHTNLVGNLWNSQGEIPGNGIDDDNNGLIDDVQGGNSLGSSDSASLPSWGNQPQEPAFIFAERSTR